MLNPAPTTVLVYGYGTTSVVCISKTPNVVARVTGVMGKLVGYVVDEINRTAFTLLILCRYC
ncbi:MAG: hypothetical protein WBH50_15445 [Fuerstiella sp.]